MNFEIPELHCHLHTVFCIGHNFETIISGEMLSTPTQYHNFVMYDDTGQKTRLELIPFCLTTISIITEIGSLKELEIRSLKNFDWLLHRP